jgi:hypothetical protein
MKVARPLLKVRGTSRVVVGWIHLYWHMGGVQIGRVFSVAVGGSDEGAVGCGGECSFVARRRRNFGAEAVSGGDKN